MASSRIFVRGLPPAITEDEFRRYFSSQQPITDAKVLPHRQIGYVGYKSPEDAAKAVKYFNKAFLRTSRLYVEIARPISDQPPAKSKGRSANDGPFQPKLSGSNGAPIENALKRKRPGQEVQQQPSDPKLEEFLDAMQPASKLKKRTVEQAFSPAEVLPAADAAESDDEYQVVAKTSKNSASVELPEKNTGNPVAIRKSQRDEHDESLEHQPAHEAPVRVMPDGPVSDADWLRSRKKRLLDLEDNGNEAARPADAIVPAQQPDVVEVIESTAADVTEEQNGANEDDGEDANETKILSTGRLYLRNLGYAIQLPSGENLEEEIRKDFAPFGEIGEVHVPVVASTGQGKGFAYVQYTNPEDAVAAYREKDKKTFQGRLLHVLPAEAKRETKLDEFEISKLPLKMQKKIQKKASADRQTFQWNSLYMNQDSVLSSIADRLGVRKSDLLDPTSSDAGVKQAQAETHLISETRAYFTENGIDLDSFKKRERGDKAILIKNFPYGSGTQIRELFAEYGLITRFMLPPSGTLAIVEYMNAPDAKKAFGKLSYRKVKDSILFLEKAPKDLFSKPPSPLGATTEIQAATVDSKKGQPSKLSATDLLQKEDPSPEAADTSTLFVRNLNFSTTSERLTEAFSALDGFLSAKVKTKVDPKRGVLSMGYGFLEFRTKDQAAAAQVAMNDYLLDDHNLLVRASHKGHDAAEERRKEDKSKKGSGKQTKIVIKNLPFEADKKDVRALLATYGQVRSVRVPKRLDNRTRGFAFAQFSTPREAENCLDALRNTHLLGRRLVLDYAEEEGEDAEAELEKMQKKVGSQVNKVALQKLTGTGRKKFNVSGNDDLDEA
ncbi:RNA-binding domain-containing protein [Lophium mytilinum]|uniref:Multiple RNA-binding domain-containing protein 1 n=1 Tax=Lophium mytilinum TaxID=390894 RepID=A0A6A6QQA3_9PEZI|nr:RNA-binding domain-containing protein [Lophium mytilinum]